jgi:Regulator of chromosome condensation (RCC1) repeat
MTRTALSGSLGLSILAWAAAGVPACGSSGQVADAADARASRDTQAEATANSGAAGRAPDASADHATLDVGLDVALEGSVIDVPDETASDAGSDETIVDAGPPLPSGSPWRALAITTGIVHACALLDNHRIKCWGANAYGCLGTGDPDDRGNVAAKMGNALPFVDLGVGRRATAIAAGRYTTCAILDTGAVKCWGISNFTGEPTSARTADGMIGNAPGELGDVLPPLDLGAGRVAIQIASGYHATCVVLDDRTARCWGDGAPIAPVAIGVRVVLQLAPANGEIIALLQGGGLSTLLPSGGPSLVLYDGVKASYVAGSETGICAVLTDGELTCTDGLPSATATATDVAAVDVEVGATCVLTRAGDVRCWGGDCGAYPVGAKYTCASKALADGSFTIALGQRATAVGTGGNGYSCALLADGGVKCWETYDTCDDAAGGSELCAVPTQTPPIVGGAVAITGTGAGRKFGAWGEIDLGTRP